MAFTTASSLRCLWQPLLLAPPPNRAFPVSAAFNGIYWRAQITPVKIIGYLKLRHLD